MLIYLHTVCSRFPITFNANLCALLCTACTMWRLFRYRTHTLDAILRNNSIGK